MFIMICLILIFCAAAGVFFWLWVDLRKESQSPQHEGVVPVVDAMAVQSLRAVEKERDVLQDAIRQLKEELNVAQVKLQDQERHEVESLRELRCQNEDFQRKAIEAVPVADDGVLRHLREENAAFKVRLDEMAGDLRQKAEEISSFSTEVRRLQAELSAAGGSREAVIEERDSFQRKLHAVSAELEQIKIDNERLKEVFVAEAGIAPFNESASARIKELEMFNVVQSQKNEYLQIELAKSRAQVVGLERVRANEAHADVLHFSGVGGESRGLVV